LKSKQEHLINNGKPEESMSHKKMNMLKTAAEEYQYKNPQWKYVQFDVLAITIVMMCLLNIFN